MMVRALKLGYFDHKRHYPEDHIHPRHGEAFEIPDDLNPRTGKLKCFSEKWMEPVSPEDAAKIAAAEAKEPARRGRPPKVKTE